MKTVPVYEAKNRFSELLASAEQGEVVSITRRGVPVARLVAEPAVRGSRADARKRIAASLARMKVLGAAARLPSNLRAIAREGLDG